MTSCEVERKLNSLVPAAEQWLCILFIDVTIWQDLERNGNYCSRPFVYISQWHSADWIQPSTVNYVQTHYLLKQLASFMFQGNKKQQKQQSTTSKSSEDLILNEGALMRRMLSRYLGCLMLFENVTVRESEGKVKWLLAGSRPRALWVDTFSGCHLLLCNMKTSNQISHLSQLPVTLIPNGALPSGYHGYRWAVPSEKERRKRAKLWTLHFYSTV